MRVLLVEDDSATAKSIEMMLRSESYVCDTTDLGEDGLEIGKLYDYDIILLDLMLPDIDGYEVLRRLRASQVKTPILILSGLAELDAKIKGLGFGADDYLTKPFDVAELLARVRALLRRAAKAPGLTGHPKYTLGKFWIRFDTGQALTQEGELSLSEKELKLMELFVGSENQALSRTDILEEVWGMDAFPTDRTVDNFIVNLRKYFEVDPANPKHFLSVRGAGYRFVARGDA